VAVANQETLGDSDPHEEIVRLEEHIEELAAKIESCRKFILASRIAVAGGGLISAAMLVGVIRSDLGLLAAAFFLPVFLTQSSTRGSSHALRPVRSW
jgi:hypothetical protein